MKNRRHECTNPDCAHRTTTKQARSNLWCCWYCRKPLKVQQDMIAKMKLMAQQLGYTVTKRDRI